MIYNLRAEGPGVARDKKIFLNFYFAFLIDIIDNIISYSQYRPYYVPS